MPQYPDRGALEAGWLIDPHQLRFEIADDAGQISDTQIRARSCDLYTNAVIPPAHRQVRIDTVSNLGVKTSAVTEPDPARIVRVVQIVGMPIAR